MAFCVLLAVVCVSTLIGSTHAVCSSCPFQWTENQGNCYRYFSASLLYKDAVEYCQHFSHRGRSASLATVTSFNELLFISKLLDDVFNASASDVPSLIWLNINSMNTAESDLQPILLESFSQGSDVIPCENSPVNNEKYQVKGNAIAASMVPGPERLDQACTVHLPVESFLDLGDFNGSCISDLESCQSHSVTWSIWLKIDTPSNSKDRWNYLSSGGQTQWARGIAFLYDATLRQFCFAIRSQHLYILQKYNIDKVPLDKWFHLAFTVDSIGTSNMDLKVFVNGELIQVDNISRKTNEGGWSDQCTHLHIGMTNSCHTDISVSQYGGSGAFSSLVVFDGLLSQQKIRNLYECRFLGQLLNIAKRDQAAVGLSLRAIMDDDHHFTIGDDNSETFCNITPATDGSPSASLCLDHMEHPFVCQL